MIVSSYLTDATAVTKSGSAASSQANTKAQAQFDDVLAKVPDKKTATDNRDSRADAPGADARQATDMASPASFFVFGQKTQASLQPASAALQTFSLSSQPSGLASSAPSAQASASPGLDAAAMAAVATASGASATASALSSALAASPLAASALTSSASPRPSAAAWSSASTTPGAVLPFSLSFAPASGVAAAVSTTTPSPGLETPLPATPAPAGGYADFRAALLASRAATADETSQADPTGGLSGRHKTDPKTDPGTTDASLGASASSAVATTPSAILSELGLAQAPLAPVTAQPAAPKVSAAAAAKSLPADTTGAVAGSPEVSAAPDDAESLALDAFGSSVSGSAAASAHSSADKGAAAALAPIIKSVAVETPLTLGPTLSPMQQVIDTVQRLASGDSAPASTPATTVAAPTLPTPTSRTMTLVLEPDNLGTVTVRMQLRGSSLDLQLDVANAQTLGLLTRDKDSLTAAMSSQDYQVGTLTMRASDPQTASQGSDNGTQNQDQRSGGSSSFQGGSSSQDGRAAPGSDSGSASSGSGGQAHRQNTARSDDDLPAQREPRALSTAGASGVYI